MDDRRDNTGGGSRYNGPPPDVGLPPPPIKIRRKPRQQAPQETVQQFWDKMNSKYPGKVFTVLPNNPYARKKAAKTPHGTVSGQRAAKSYEEARAECIRDVDRIIKECRRLNQKYRDLHFDIEWDLKSGQRNCLDGLSTPGDSMKPKGVKRVTDIFEKPQFYINGPTAGDVRQGRDGDCYLMAALCGLGNMEGLIDKVCVKHDMDVGVYGFVFFRDGEWQHTIIDDKLYLRAPDYDEAQDERVVWDDINRADSAEEYRKAHQTGSRALYFAQCSDENETWLPLLEKAYAKAHGDFASIDGGFTGEAIEDLTGGVTTEIYSTDILDRDAFWRDELMQVGKSFLFGCATGFYSNWLNTSGVPREREGISEGHAYSIMDAKEINGQRLLKLRNPWGKKEWTGKWSDGSSEWTPEWMHLLDHKFGNDGIFWISYEDLLKKYQHFDRTRIFGPEWNVTQCWTSVNVSWSAEYHSTKFSLTLERKARVVIVLAQLDDTYFGGLEGGYGFDLQFRLESDDKEDEDDYIVRSNGNYAMARSVSTDTELEAGTYSVLMKITATRHTDREHLEDVLPVYAATRREKLIQMGLSYDLAHAKGVIVETEAERQERKARNKARKIKERQKLKEKMKAQAEKHWRKERERHKREKERQARNRQRRERKERADTKLQEAGGADLIILPDAVEKERPERLVSSDRPKQENEGVENDQAVAEQTVSKSSRAKDVMVMKGHDTTDNPPRDSGPQSTTTPTEHVSAANVVQSLDEVIKAADAETQASRPEATSEENTPAPEEKPPTTSVKADGVATATVTDVHPLLTSPPISHPEHEVSNDYGPDLHDVMNGSRGHPQRSDTLDTTAAMIGIGMGAGGSEGSNDDMLPDLDIPAVHENDDIAAEDGHTSDADSFPPFDWNSELDMPSELSSSEESSSCSHRGRYRPGGMRSRRRRRSRGSHRHGRGGGGGLISPPPGVTDIDAKSADEANGPEEPWNAVCVVGLRVYSTLDGEEVKLRVVRLRGDDSESEDDAGSHADDEFEKLSGSQMKLDPDDISKGAMSVAVARDNPFVEEDVKDEPKATDVMKRGNSSAYAYRM
ncbi:uncharacterized protein Z518_03819 [Rhinocladiella mackenziei CBS 650.93]|uniref:Calpain catalytic domain-containing protein n=1 Tax=Rhinocladiella mackenziei CBS 650.93 TaxID=1442369 RepID=A0A0D2IRT1_9EURO|nr:uncharacterized protein Z518_03819 [Rhinocladiella mackenziei CBS 650.93]KIX05846.1 hypothetical protein Z518_03819 [Rhinocladiella mackenziei CBS 650.93]